MRSAAPVMQNHLSKPKDLMLQSATPQEILMNMSLVLRLPREIHLSRSSANVPRLPLFLEMPQNPHVLLTFGRVQNPGRLPHETTLRRPKVARTCGDLYMLTSKRALRHNGVHFFDISTSKSGPTLRCFVHFDFETGFAPQRRARFQHLNFLRTRQFLTLLTSTCPARRKGVHIFRHLNFQKWSEPGVLSAF